ncbi:VOC family protein [Fibrella arboris]|uniref:VOC family protein n=1 Tax=Fibrella arboris TaxID=3242486 RepID=UPI0035221258
MALLNPFIYFNGNAEEAFTFYRSVFGGEFARVARYKDIASADYPISENDANRLMHIALPIGKSNMLLGSDVMEHRGQVMVNDNRYTIVIQAEGQEEADALFSGLSAGGRVEMPISYGPGGNYFGMFTDRFGVQWMLDFDPRRGENA